MPRPGALQAAHHPGAMSRGSAGEIRDRIVAFKRVRAVELVPHPENWRVHGADQRSALSQVLERLGIVSAIVTRQLEDGRLQILDGHLRADVLAEEMVPVVVVNLTEEEAREVLATFDPLASMATANTELLRALVDGLRGQNEGLDTVLSKAELDFLQLAPNPTGAAPAAPPADAGTPPPPEGVRVIQLFFEASKHARFVHQCGQIGGALSTTNLTDTVIAVVENAHRELGLSDA
jgi:ParB-like nuclease family protein